MEEALDILYAISSPDIKKIKKKITSILKQEKKINLENKKTFTKFFKKINFVKKIPIN